MLLMWFRVLRSQKLRSRESTKVPRPQEPRELHSRKTRHHLWRRVPRAGRCPGRRRRSRTNCSTGPGGPRRWGRCTCRKTIRVREIHAQQLETAQLPKRHTSPLEGGREGTQAGAKSTWRPAVKGYCCGGREGRRKEESSCESVSLKSPSDRNGKRKESLWLLTVQLYRC